MPHPMSEPWLSDQQKDVLRYFRDRCQAYVDDAPADGGHSDKAGGSAYELIMEAVDQLDALLDPTTQ